MIEVLFKKLYDDVEVPQYAHPGDSGFDIAVHNFKHLYSSQEMCPDGIPKGDNLMFQDNKVYTLSDGTPRRTPIEWVTLSPHSRVLVGTGYSIAIKPEWYELQVRSRGSYSLKQGLIVCNSPGTVDNGYRGEIGVILLNTSAFHITIKKGDRVAQGVFTHISAGIFIVSETLPDTKRGSGAYGSTDKPYRRSTSDLNKQMDMDY